MIMHHIAYFALASVNSTMASVKSPRPKAQAQANQVAFDYAGGCHGRCN